MIHQAQSLGEGIVITQSAMFPHRVTTDTTFHSPRMRTQSSLTQTWPAFGSIGPRVTSPSQAWPPLQRSGSDYSEW